MVVYPVNAIKSVVAMIPHSELSADIMGAVWNECVFVVEKPGLDVASLGGVIEDENTENTEDENM